MSAETGRPETDRGIRCRKCGGTRFDVLETRKMPGNRIMRRRSCLGCGERVTTHERAFGTA